MKWIKKGHIFKPSGEFDWAHSYAQIPRPLVLDDKIRIYYATRYFDQNKMPVSQTSFIDLDKLDLTKILYIHDKPLLELGDIGSFSHFGIHPTMLLHRDNKVLFFYQGWDRRVSVPYETAVGLAVSNDNGFSFSKTGNMSIFGKSEEDPFFVNGVFVLNQESQYHMWYSSGYQWIKNGENKESVYIIKHATSSDLTNWQRTNNGCIEPKFEYECQNSATVIKIREKYHMWFCYRHALDFRNSNRGYRIGYAWSLDLANWHRDDSLAGIDISYNESWDSQMVCYPYVFETDGRILMLYSGNYFGKEGFGYAELEINDEK